MNARVQSLRFRTNQNEAKWQRAVQEHERMLQALDARDANALRSVLIEHLHQKRDTILELMRSGEIDASAAEAQEQPVSSAQLHVDDIAVK